MGCSSVSTRAEQAWRARPLIRMEQDPQTDSMQFDSHTGGATRLPSMVTGFSRMAMRAETTLCSAR